MRRVQGQDFNEVPILDLSGLHRGRLVGRDAVVQTLRGYLERIGFLYVSGHGVPAESVAAVRAANRRFHALALEDDTQRHGNQCIAYSYPLGYNQDG